MRSAYRSEWRLGSDSTVTTPGRYVFAPDDTPHLERWHPFGSRNWTTDDFRDGDPSTGEVRGTRQRWANGRSPDPYPVAALVGNAELLEQPEAIDGTCGWEFVSDNGSTWALADDVPTWSAEDSLNCGGTNDQIQTGRATRKVVTSIVRRVTASLDFNVERQNAGFDICEVTIAGQTIVSAEGQGDGLGCAMLSGTALGSVTIGPGQHQLAMDCSTVDALYHVDLFFRLTLEYDPPFETDPREWYQGFPLACYVPNVEPPSGPPLPPDVASTSGQLAIIRVIATLYDDPSAAGDLLQTIMGNDAVIAVVPNSASIIPGTVIGVRDDLCIVCIAGTSNFNQAMDYVLNTLTGVLDQGTWSTNATWLSAAVAVHARVVALGADPAGRIILSGHSYGGAVGEVMGLQYRDANASRAIECLTFGAPKPADVRGARILGTCRTVRVVNVDDPIPTLPPSRQTMAPFVLVIPAPLINLWTVLTQPLGQLLVGVDGQLTESEPEVIDYGFLLLVVVYVVSGTPIPFPFPHSSAEYVRRLELANGVE